MLADLRADALVIWRSRLLWVALWVLTRGWIYQDWAQHYRHVWNDVRYYHAALAQPGLGFDRLGEYPVPVLWILGALELPAHEVGDYLVWFGVAMAALDAWFSIIIYRSDSMRALLFWTTFILGYGALLWFRYDMVPALVVGLAALWVTRHPRASGALVAVGASLKLWPALLIAPLIGRHPAGRARLLWFGITGAGLALLSLLMAGPARLVSPLGFQGDRGLQIESVPATWLMFQRLRRTDLVVEYSKFNAYEVFGAGVSQWLRLADVVMVVVVASALGMAVVAWWRKALPADLLTLMLVAIVAGMLVANKTFSPQYLIWLAAPVTALIIEAKSKALYYLAAGLGVCLVAMGWMTQQIYPALYGGLISNPSSGAEATSMLVTRNLLLVVVWLVSLIGSILMLLKRGPVGGPRLATGD